MSLKPGIGAAWLKKYWSDVFPEGKVVVNGRECNSPRYYDRIYRRVDDDGMAALQMVRGLHARGSFADRSDERLAVREVVAEARVKQLKRSL